MKKADYKSPTFYKILESINKVFTKYNKQEIKPTDGIIFKSKFDTGRFDNTMIWRITGEMMPELDKCIEHIQEVRTQLKADFPQYDYQTITIGIYPKENPEHLSIKIMLCNLADNYITRQDLVAYQAGDEVAINKCNEIESRMYKRDSDNRDSQTRINDFIFSLNYEPKLEQAELKNISSLKLMHQDEVITLEPDSATDFKGIINDKEVTIEGKSTKAIIDYRDNDYISKLEFARYIAGRISNNSLGSLHNADFVLFVLRQAGDVICFEVANTKNNWLAGHIDL